MTSVAPCSGEPVSWLRLEQFHLGEARGRDRGRIADHLAGCGACAACLAQIEDDSAHALPPLPALAPIRPVGVLSVFPARTAAALGALAAAAAFALTVGGDGAGHRGALASGSRIKGNAIAFSLVREDGERVSGGAGVYRDGDRFKAIVTCPPGGATSFDVVVYEGEKAYFPLDPANELRCGNEVPLPGAFRLTGRAEERVCLVWKDGGAIDRSALRTEVDADGDESVCKSLVPAPSP